MDNEEIMLLQGVGDEEKSSPAAYGYYSVLSLFLGTFQSSCVKKGM